MLDKNKKVVSIEIDNDGAFYEYNDSDCIGVYFFGGGSISGSSRDVISKMIETKKACFDKNLDIEEKVIEVLSKPQNTLDLLETFTVVLQDLIEDDGFWELSKFAQVLSEQGYTLELQEYIEESDEVGGLLDELIEACGFKSGTVGYSQWTRFVALKDIDISYISDLWEGNNFYTIFIQDLQGNDSHSISGIYSPDIEKEIKSIVEEHFEATDFYIVDNEQTQYFTKENWEMVEEIQTVTSEYHLIED